MDNGRLDIVKIDILSPATLPLPATPAAGETDRR